MGQMQKKKRLKMEMANPSPPMQVIMCYLLSGWCKFKRREIKRQLSGFHVSVVSGDATAAITMPVSVGEWLDGNYSLPVSSLLKIGA